MNYSEGFFFFFFGIVAYIAHIGTRGAVHEGDVLVGKGAKLDSLSLTHSPAIYIKFNYPFDELIHKQIGNLDILVKNTTSFLSAATVALLSSFPL